MTWTQREGRRKNNALLDTSTNHNSDVRYNEIYGKPTNSATQELTGNPAYNKITRERNNWSAQDLSNNEMDTKKRKKGVDTSTNCNNDARYNDKYEKKLLIPPHKGSPVTLQTMKGHKTAALVTVITQTIQLMQ